MTLINQTAALLASRPYEVKLEPDVFSDGEPGFFASVRELPGCFGQGHTEAEAMADVKSAMVEYIEHLMSNGHPVPQPLAVATKSVNKVLFVNFSQRVSMSVSTTSSLDTHINLIPELA